jgi:hypothetical protein
LKGALMRKRALIGSVLILVFGAVLLGQANAQEKKNQPTMEQMMANYAKFAQPGQYHKYLEPTVGSWDCVAKMWMDPASGPQESKATSETKWVLGGRFVQENVSGEMGGTPFQGVGLSGYDNVKKEFVSIWADEMSTSILYTTGQCDSTGKVFTMFGSYTDPMSDMQEKKFRMVTRIISNDQHVNEMYDTAPDGKEFKSFEITYNRKK